MRCLLLPLSLLGGVLWAQQGSGSLVEPPQSVVFHVERADFRQLQQVREKLQRSGLAAQVLLCERGGYLVCLPAQALEEKAFSQWVQALHSALSAEGLTLYEKPGASVVELAQNCDQLLKELLELQTR